jgi:phosphatidate cytidylyltransferase
MPLDAPSLAILIGFAALSLLLVLCRTTPLRFPLDHYLPYVWTFFLAFGVAELWSFKIGIWVLAVLCFVSLKEFFTLVDIRWQDRWAVLGAYAAIPFTIYFIQIEWYGMFIISVPVYAFLVVPFLVALGGSEARGAVLSIGIIDFGLFLFVYCVGHLGYLALYSTWKALVVILGVIVSDLVATLVQARRRPGLGRTALRCLISVPLVIGLYQALSGWTGIGTFHSVVLGAMTPLLAAIGRYTIAYIESDLGVDRESAVPGKGRIVDTLRSFLYVSPVAFHYIRYFGA